MRWNVRAFGMQKLLIPPHPLQAIAPVRQRKHT